MSRVDVHLTPKQWRRIFNALRPLPSKAKTAKWLIETSMAAYFIAREDEKDRLPSKERKRRLYSAYKAAYRLNTSLKTDSLRHHPHAQELAELLPRLLESLESSQEPSTSSHKDRLSIERRYLWEPLLWVWRRSGRELTYSEDGPLVRFISVVHEACRGDTPSAHSIREAVQKWQAMT